MPYWNYQRVEKRIKRDPWYIPYGYEAIYQRLKLEGLDGRIDLEDATGEIEDRVWAMVWDLSRYLEPVPMPAPDEYVKWLLDVIVAHQVSWTVRKATEGQRPALFFLEPIIAEALTSTFVSGVGPEHIREIPAPARIFLPPIYTLSDEQRGEPYGGTLDEVMILGTPTAVSQEDEDAVLKVHMATRTEIDEVSVIRPGEKITMLAEGYIAVRKGETLEDALQRYAASDEETAEQRLVAFRLLINLLLYWKSEDADILKQLNPHYEKSHSRMTKKTGKKRERAKKALKQIPRNQHYVFGQKLEIIRRRKEKERITTEDTEQPTPTGRHQPHHMRRGHWRWQPCGPEKQNRKLIFIEAYWAGKDPPKDKLGYSVRS